MLPIHKRDQRFPGQALHYHWAGFKKAQLTDDPEKVTCGTCFRMMGRAKRVSERDK